MFPNIVPSEGSRLAFAALQCRCRCMRAGRLIAADTVLYSVASHTVKCISLYFHFFNEVGDYGCSFLHFRKKTFYRFVKLLAYLSKSQI